MRTLYRERRDVLIRGLASAGWDVPSPEGSMFAWAPMPPRYAALGSVEFSKLLLARAKVAVAPGLGFGEHGEGYRAHRAGGEHPPAAPGGAQYPGVHAGGEQSGGGAERGGRVLN